MIGRGSIVFAAVHMGPYQSLASVEPLLSVRPLWAVGGLARHRRAQRGEPFVDGAAIAAAGGGAAFLRAVGARVVVRGTSDDVDDDNVEDVVADGAGAIGLPVLVVEDFPGNFQGFLKQDGDALCVETEAVAELHTTRGTAPARIHVTGNPRYDALRDVDALARRATVRQELDLGERPVALWVGQPDADHSYRTLETILPALRQAESLLLFRAHPRDAEYVRGRYAGLLGAAAHVVDVTTYADVTSLCCAADLVITQFSSVAVEGGYLGIPALFVLLPDLGGAYIKKRKGYAIPPLCKENCAFLLDDAKMAADVVSRALYDPVSREAVRTNFARRYASRPPSAPAIAQLITNSLEG